MLMPALQMVPSSDMDIHNESNTSVCSNCLDPVGTCYCSWQILQLDASYSIYSMLNDDMNKPSSSTTSSILDNMNKLDGLNCGGIPTRTTPTLTPTTLRNIAADIASLSPSASENFAIAAASDLHHLVSPSCTTLNVSSSGPSDRSSDLQDRHTLQNLGTQHLSLQNLNNQHININDLQNQQNLNQNSLNQQQQNDYNNSFSSAASRQAGFVPPLVLQINSSNIPQASGINNNSSGSNSVFSAKGTSSASSSHWQGAVVTQRPYSQTNSRIKQRFTDDEDYDEDNDSIVDYGTDSSDTMSGKVTQKQNSKNNSKSRVKGESKNTANSGRRTNNKDNKIMSAEEEQRRQIRRERNKLAAARCRKRRMDHTNELLVETEQLEEKKLRLQVEIQSLRQQKTNLQDMLAQHKCTMNNGSVSNSVSTVNHTTTVLDSNNISESGTTVLSSNISTPKRNPLQQQNISTNVNSDNNSNNGIDSIKCDDHSVSQSNIDNKDNMDIIPATVLQQPQRRRPTTLLELNNGNFSNIKKNSGNGSTGVVVLNFDSLMDGGTGLTPVSTNVGTVQNHQQIQRSVASNSVNTDNNGVLS